MVRTIVGQAYEPKFDVLHDFTPKNIETFILREDIPQEISKRLPWYIGDRLTDEASSKLRVVSILPEPEQGTKACVI